jgi:MoaA/NifB/PqqE/SkfB family radical SAM enzyme
MGFICNWFNEIVILSNGNVTTCCLDAKGENVYGNIYDHSFEEIKEKFITYRKKLIKDPVCLPRCAFCYKEYSKKEKGVATFNVKCDPSDEEIEIYLEDGNKNSGNLVIEPSANCSLKCIGCIHSSTDMKTYRGKMFLELDYLQSWIAPHIEHFKRIRYFNYGETLLHPGAIDFCSFVKQLNREFIIIIATNGMPLNSHEKRVNLIRSRVDSIYFSIHGSCQDSVQRYMTSQFDFSKIMETLSDLILIRQNLGIQYPEIVWKYILFEWNDTDSHIQKAKDLANKIGIDSILFTLTSAPSPSRRFTSQSDDWKKLTENLSFLWDFAASWKCG